MIVSADMIFTFPKEIKVHEKPFVALLWTCYNFDTLGMAVKGQEVRGAAEITIPLRERHAQSTPIETQHLWHPRQGFHFQVNVVFLEKDDRNCWGLGFSKKKTSVQHTFCYKDSQRDKLYSESVSELCFWWIDFAVS